MQWSVVDGPGRYEMLEFTLENACNKIKFPMIYAMPHVRIYESLVHRDIWLQRRNN